MYGYTDHNTVTGRPTSSKRPGAYLGANGVQQELGITEGLVSFVTQGSLCSVLPEVIRQRSAAVAAEAETLGDLRPASGAVQGEGWASRLGGKVFATASEARLELVSHELSTGRLLQSIDRRFAQVYKHSRLIYEDGRGERFAVRVRQLIGAACSGDSKCPRYTRVLVVPKSKPMMRDKLVTT